MLFVSSAGKKTPQQLGICYYDNILVSLRMDTSSEKLEEESKPQINKGNESKNRRNKSKRSNRGGHSQPVHVEDEEDGLREQHSKAISRVFEEAEDKFRKIRQKINALSLKRTMPKKRGNKPEKCGSATLAPRSNSSLQGLSGKAGKSQFVVHVGEVANLYKTTKPAAFQSSSLTRRDIMIDLHGLTREEALSTLNESLLGWIDIAMKGGYPWVVPVTIVCGGGNQMLAETVKNWIKQNNKVANVPKSLYC